MTIKPSTGDHGRELEWFKSSHSTDDGPSCVEVAASPGTVHVRDSKDVNGAQLAFTEGPWTGFVAYAANR
ncbi:DUF397 domain-containing protein [Streptomyces sp. NPDC002730]|uniref:DUF397 domain-containing protein n=1 Tax=Streptomyces sp. NPDC002730 TaxID=3364662 RepID=UPI0036A37C35